MLNNTKLAYWLVATSSFGRQKIYGQAIIPPTGSFGGPVGLRQPERFGKIYSVLTIFWLKFRPALVPWPLNDSLFQAWADICSQQLPWSWQWPRRCHMAMLGFVNRVHVEILIVCCGTSMTAPDSSQNVSVLNNHGILCRINSSDCDRHAHSRRARKMALSQTSRSAEYKKSNILSQKSHNQSSSTIDAETMLKSLQKQWNG